MVGVSLALARCLTLGAVALAFPVASVAVFHFGADRVQVADLLAVVYSFGIFLGCTTSLWPLRELQNWDFNRRVDSMAFVFMVMSYVTHLTWELAWLVAGDTIVAARDEAWAYTWWAYIDGGDERYATRPASLVVIEALSVANGLVGFTGLYLLHRSGGKDLRGVLLCLATAVVHLYSTCLYYGGEIVEGLPNVDTTSFFAMYIKFGLANAPWVVFPWAVMHWGIRRLIPQNAERRHQSHKPVHARR